ncbi:hypothetical protein MAPG_09275 [Magnaporthiopsis poae ATCC 64411]|uniref:2EXR domain-containing protein n=1 Tax=Magnaporthiopsis poae (strain ATCC 64411 / 73-15) TaxID=644358 RepID=A0A0C4E9I5_MAGP6|nr:hypothetical protein MAPG_09275 [Magnaporthiopsis poae ATCC 64411]
MTPDARALPRFSQLPKELRDQIWSYAANEPDRKPGVHFLSVSDHESWIAEDEDKDLVGSLKRLLTTDAVDGALPVRFYASARPNESSPGGGPGRNPSTYMTNQGMWAACLESRAVMTRKMSHAHNKAKLCFPVGNSSRCFEVLPQDLICVKTFDLARTFVDITTPEYPYRGAEHVAWEFDPTMLPFVDGDDFNKLLSAKPPNRKLEDVQYDVAKAAAGAKACLERFWLIDYRIKRLAAPGHDQPKREGRKNRFVFYGNGCRFVEVQLGDTEWEYCGLPPASAAEVEGSVFWIRRQLEIAYWEFYRRENGHDDPYYPLFQFWPEELAYEIQDGGFEDGATTGVLACEDWE